MIERQNTVGFTIRALSNLLRRKMFELVPPPPERAGVTEMEGQIMGYLCDHPDREFYQKDVEEMFCIRRSTASRFLKGLERGGLLVRQSVPRDARLKKLVPTEKAISIHEEINRTNRELEDILTADLTREELESFLSTAHKIQRNLLR